MRVEIKKEENGAVLIEVEGEVDMLTSPEVRNVLLPYFNKGTLGIVVDLSQVTYMDSSGIATMIEGLQWSKKEGKRFVVAGLQEKVMDVFVLTNLKDVFEFSEDPLNSFNDISNS